MACLKLLFLLLPIFFANTFAADPYSCANDKGNYNANSIYQKNLNLLLRSSLPSKIQSDQNGFYNLSMGQSPDQVNVILLCRGDATQDDCLKCLNQSIYELQQNCPNQKEAVVWPDKCMLRFSNRTIFGQSETQPTYLLYRTDDASNVTSFSRIVGSFVKTLNTEAAAGDSLKKFAVGETNYNDFQTVYAQSQCTPDLTELDCKSCLEGLRGVIPSGKLGGKFINPSCVIRFEVYPFYTPIQPIPSPSPPTATAPSLPPTSGTTTQGNDPNLYS